jgi:hypothetical protein
MTAVLWGDGRNNFHLIVFDVIWEQTQVLKVMEILGQETTNGKLDILGFAWWLLGPV